MGNISRSKLPPGPSYVVRKLLSWKTAGYLFSVALIHAGADAVGVYAPVWAIVISSVLAFPAVLYIQSELRYKRDERAAATLGARLAPRVPGKMFLGMDLIAALMEAFGSGYIGES